MNKQLYYVSKCDEGDGIHTWDVVRRPMYAFGNTMAVSNHDTRAQARRECRERNHEATASGMAPRTEKS